MSFVNPLRKFGQTFKPSSILSIFFSNRVKMFLTLIVSVFLIPSCLSLLQYNNQKTPREIVQIFMAAYGTPRISQLANYTTSYFRNYKPKELWIIETWEILRELGYRHVTGRILEEKIQKNTAIIITSSSIETLAGETLQKEIFCFIKTGDGWKLDELFIEEEIVETEKYNL